MKKFISFIFCLYIALPFLVAKGSIPTLTEPCTIKLLLPENTSWDINQIYLKCENSNDPILTEGILVGNDLTYTFPSGTPICVNGHWGKFEGDESDDFQVYEGYSLIWYDKSTSTEAKLNYDYTQTTTNQYEHYVNLKLLSGDTIYCYLLTEKESTYDYCPYNTTLNGNNIIADQNHLSLSDTIIYTELNDYYQISGSVYNSWTQYRKYNANYQYDNSNGNTQPIRYEQLTKSRVLDCSNSELLKLKFRTSLQFYGSDISSFDWHKNIGLKITHDGLHWQDIPFDLYPVFKYLNNIYISSDMTVEIDLSQYISETLQIAFFYTATEEYGVTWKISNISISTTNVSDSPIKYGSVENAQLPAVFNCFYDTNNDGVMEYFCAAPNNKKTIEHRRFDGLLLNDFASENDVILVDNIDRVGNVELFLNPLSTYSLEQYRINNQLADKGLYIAFDANNDGRKDFFYQHEKSLYILYQQPDASFISEKVELITSEEELNNTLFYQGRPNQTFIDWSFTIPSLRDGMIISDNRPSITAYQHTNAQIIDINYDGYKDIINIYEGNSLLSVADGKYYFANIGGEIISRDFNNDGYYDFIAFANDQVTLYIYDGKSYSSKKLISNLALSSVECYDFDHDTDIDILLLFDHNSKSEYAIVAFFENNNGKFIKHEAMFDKGRRINFLDCVDADNDGIFELFFAEHIYGSSDNNLLMVDLKDFTISNEMLLIDNDIAGHYNGNGKFFSADFDNDGFTEYQISLYNGIYSGKINASKPNTPPAKASKPTMVYDVNAGFIKLNWNAGVDNESSTCDLTYSIRIGSTPGADDIWYGDANLDGRRLKLEQGNVGHQTYQLVSTKNWQQGKYYIAVQTIDANGLGGPWSDELVFDYNGLFADFIIQNNNDQLYTVDTISVALSSTYNPEYTYTWNFGEDCIILSQNEGICKLIYPNGGTKTISLSVQTPNGQQAYSTTDLEVIPISWTDRELLEINPITIEGILADVNQNGNLDLLGNAGQTSGVYINNGNGNFDRLGRIYNLDLSLKNPTICDINKDGLFDFFDYNSSKGAAYINEGNADFSTIDKDEVVIEGFSQKTFKSIADLNNDGFIDAIAITSSDIVILWNNANIDNPLHFTAANLNTNIRNINNLYLYDINRDGYLDILFTERSYEKLYLILNKGIDQQFDIENITTIAQIFDLKNLQFADFDNDSDIDIISRSQSYGNLSYIELLKNNGNNEFTEVDLLYKGESNTSSSINILDIDNNGYLDIICNANASYCSRVIYNYGTKFIVDKYSYNQYSNSDFQLLNGDINNDGVFDTYRFTSSTNHTNSQPAAPINVIARQIGASVILSWNHATDKETPQTHMQYNISLRELNSDTYIISPLNAGDTLSALSAAYHYYNTNQLSLPQTLFEVGKTYQLTVQALDGWIAHSPFSEPYTFKIGYSAEINSVAEACINDIVTFQYIGNAEGDLTWFINDQKQSTTSSTLKTSFPEEGAYTIRVTNANVEAQTAIIINDGPNLVFEFPTEIIAHTEVRFKLPEAYRSGKYNITLRSSANANESVIFKPINDTIGSIVANLSNGNHWIEFTSFTPTCGESTYRRNFNVTGKDIKPYINLVTVDATSGKNYLEWGTISDNIKSIFNKIQVYKEIGIVDNFVKIAEVDITETGFIDHTSDPNSQQNFYRIAYATTSGAAGIMSDVYSTVHLMLNQGYNTNSVNLIWTAPDGIKVSGYIISRGYSTDQMTEITRLSGRITAYTDYLQSDTAKAFYAIGYTVMPHQSAAPQHRAAPQELVGTSNTANSLNSHQFTLAQNLSIYAIESDILLENTKQKTLHLYTELYPAFTTYKNVAWNILEGTDLASITTFGQLNLSPTINKSGNITVEARTLDGSNIATTLNIPVHYTPIEIPDDTIPTIPDDTIPETIKFDYKLLLSAPSDTLTNKQNELIIQANIITNDTTPRFVSWSIPQGSELIQLTDLGSNSAKITYINSGEALVQATIADIDTLVYAQKLITLEEEKTVSLEHTQSAISAIYVNNNTIFIDIVQPTEIIILSIDGKTIKTLKPTNIGTIQLHLPKGVYIINNHKVII